MFRVALFLFALSLALLPLSASAAAAPLKPETPCIVAGTEHLADMARDLLDGRVEILTLVPASSCPGHSDMKASEMAFFFKAHLVLLHVWQKDYPGVGEAMRAAGLPEEKLHMPPGRGSLLVPDNQIAASRHAAEILSALPGVDKGEIEKRLAARIERIRNLERECLALLEPYAATPVLCAAMQREFIVWTGMKPTGTYGRAEDMDPRTLMALVDNGKKSGVRLVVDNLQSGAGAGLPLARELGAAHATLSNFPGNSPETATYELLLKHGTSLLVQALEGNGRTGVSGDAAGQ